MRSILGALVINNRSSHMQLTFFTRRPYCPRRIKKLCLCMLSLAVKHLRARLSMHKQSFFSLWGQYGRRVKKVNCSEPRACKMLARFRSAYPHSVSYKEILLRTHNKAKSICHRLSGTVNRGTDSCTPEIVAHTSTETEPG